ncbi:DUF262 domain-containing protein [Thiohalocapsa marina]|uniref:DUF262 domain-containing protein n=1 Tax=Thiohalocapsa marina TaxID=424902 RepID=UPI0036DA03AD
MTKSLTPPYTPLQLINHLVFPGTVPGNDEPHIFLPIIQRESVWQPTQVCELWDSLLRGIPLPSLILSQFHDSYAPSIKVDDDSNKWHPSSKDYLLLDGQQRARALLTGLDRICDSNILLQRLWLDLDWPHREDPNDSQGTLDEHGLRFGFFLCTQASPWGHDRARNGRPNRKKIAAAREALFQSNWYPDFSKGGKRSGCFDFQIPLEFTWPVEAHCPLPFKSILDYLIKNHSADKKEWGVFLKETFNSLEKSLQPKVTNGSNCTLQLFKPLSDEIIDRVASQLHTSLPPLLTSTTINAVVANLPPEELLPAFKRINRNGSDVKNEELFFAAIKQQEPSCDDLARLAGTRLSPLDVVRGAVILATQPPLSDTLDPSQPRLAERTPPIELSPATIQTLKMSVGGAGGLAQKLSNDLDQTSRFRLNFDALTNDLLLFKAGNSNDKGLPGVMLPRLGVTSWLPPLVWLISRQSQPLSISPSEPERILQRERILQYVLVDHFFADWYPDKAKMLRDLIDYVAEEAGKNKPFPKTCEIRDRLSVYVKSPTTSSPAWLRSVADPSFPQSQLVLPLTPKEWESFLKRWIHQNKGWLPNVANYGGVLPGLADDLLMWSQREAMDRWFRPHSKEISRFSKIDQPWDIDHIVAQSFFDLRSTQIDDPSALDNLLKSRFITSLPSDRAWQSVKNVANRFGNKRLWPSGFNRQDGDTPAEEKLSPNWLSGLAGWKVLSGWVSGVPNTPNPIIDASRISSGQKSNLDSTRKQKEAWNTSSVSEFLDAVIGEQDGREIDIYRELFDFLESGLTCHDDWSRGASGSRFTSDAAASPG